MHRGQRPLMCDLSVLLFFAGACEFSALLFPELPGLSTSRYELSLPPA